MKRQLWDHQEKALTALRQTIGQGIKRIVLSSPCGSGKTLLSAAIVEGALKKKKKVAFVVSNLSLIDQTVEMMAGEGIEGIGVIQSDHVMSNWSKPVQVASIQTIQSRKAFPEADIVIIDECHILFNTHKEWMANEEWKAKPFIGLSATPYTKGLGKHFDTLITVATTKELIDKGILSPFRTFATGHPDLKGVKIIAGDYHEGQLSERMQDGKLTADIVETWQKRWGKDKTLCFGVDCAHAQMIQRRFQEAGISCGYQDANTPQSDRAAIRRSFQRGDMRIVSNVGTLTTGTDLDVRCLIFARPTRSKILYQQIVGRALRRADGKEHAIILDHSDTTKRLGFITDLYCEELDDGTGKNAEAVGKEIAKERMPKECKQCASLMPNGSRKCPNCGSEQKVMSGIVERDGELVEVAPGEAGRKSKKNKTSTTMDEKIVFFAELKGYGIQHHYKEGWAAMKYKEKFEVWPNDVRLRSAMPASPTEKTLSWIKSRQIAWAKSKKRAETGGDKNVMTAREQQIIDRVRDQYVPGTFCTEKDLEDFR